MRYKTVPEPHDLESLHAVGRAVPLVPGDEEDCCARIASRTEVPGRDVAREWLTFLEALGLVAEGKRGYHRIRADPDRDVLADRFLDNVFGAREVFEATDRDGPIDAKTAFAALEKSVPRWERHRNPDWEREWEETTERLLEWAVTFGLLEANGDGRYRFVDQYSALHRRS
jgi:hypothetical protein